VRESKREKVRERGRGRREARRENGLKKNGERGGDGRRGKERSKGGAESQGANTSPVEHPTHLQRTKFSPSNGKLTPHPEETASTRFSRRLKKAEMCRTHTTELRRSFEIRFSYNIASFSFRFLSTDPTINRDNSLSQYAPVTRIF
jgi:hypothetical protein